MGIMVIVFTYLLRYDGALYCRLLEGILVGIGSSGRQQHENLFCDTSIGLLFVELLVELLKDNYESDSNGTVNAESSALGVCGVRAVEVSRKGGVICPFSSYHNEHVNVIYPIIVLYSTDRRSIRL